MQTLITIYLTSNRAYVARYERARGRLSCRGVRDVALTLPALPRHTEDVALAAQSLKEALSADWPPDAAATLVIPAAWCFSESVGLPAPRWNEEAALFEIEPHLPASLEELACAAARRGSRRALVVGAFAEPLRHLLDVLESCGVAVESVGIDVERLARSQQPRGVASTKIALLVGDQLTVAVRDDAGAVERFCSLRLAPSGDLQGRQVRAAVCALLAPAETPWHLHSFADASTTAAVRRALEEHGAIERECDIAQAAALILEPSGEAAGMLELRKGPLEFRGRWRPLLRRGRRAAALAACFLAIVAINLRLANRRLERIGDEVRGKIARLYRDTFPGEPVPAAPALRLVSERLKLAALTERAGRSDPRAAHAAPLAALELLREAALRTPATLKLDLTELSVEASGIRLAGKTTEHGAAGELTAALNQSPRLKAQPPFTKLSADGLVDLRLAIEARDPGDHE